MGNLRKHNLRNLSKLAYTQILMGNFNAELGKERKCGKEKGTALLINNRLTKMAKDYIIGEFEITHVVIHLPDHKDILNKLS